MARTPEERRTAAHKHFHQQPHQEKLPFFSRHLLLSPPPRVEYSLSDLTRFLLPRGTLGVAAGQDRLAVAGGKLAFGTQEAGHEEVKERPQLQNIILERRWVTSSNYILKIRKDLLGWNTPLERIS